MILRIALLALGFALFSGLNHAYADAGDERRAAAELLAFGRPDDKPEAGDASPKATLESVVAGLRSRLEGNPALAREVASKAWHDVFGSDAAPGTMDGTGKGALYVEHVRNFLKDLRANKAEYHAVITRAYQEAAQRAPHDIEYAYWEQRDAVPFMLLTACIEHWAQRNAPGLMSTTGEPTISIHSRELFTARVSPALAVEARDLAGLSPLDGWTTAREHHVIAPGADGVIAVGGIHFVAAGR